MSWKLCACGTVFFLCLGLAISVYAPDAQPFSRYALGMLICAFFAVVFEALTIWAIAVSDDNFEDYDGD